MTTPVLTLGSVSLITIGLGTALLVRKRSRWFLGLAWISLGLAVAFAFVIPDLTGGHHQTSVAIRMRLVLGSLSFIVLMITLESVRRFAMEARYALLWVFTGLILMVFAVYPDAVGWLAKTTGMTYVSAITMVVFAFLLLVSFHFSIALSSLRDNQKKLSQKIAELELRLEQFRKQDK
jgi:hypothetical protein